jgi:hypothetical protein
MIQETIIAAQVAYAAGAQLQFLTTADTEGKTLATWGTALECDKEAMVRGVGYIATHPYDLSQGLRFFEAYRQYLNDSGWVYGETVNVDTKVHPWAGNGSLSTEVADLFHLYARVAAALTYPTF